LAKPLVEAVQFLDEVFHVSEASLAELNRFLIWISDDDYRYTLIHVDLLIKKLKCCGNLPNRSLSPEFFVFYKAGSGTFSDVYYAIMPKNFPFPLVAIKRLSPRVSDALKFHLNTSKMSLSDIIVSMKMHELQALRLFTNCQHIVGLAVDFPSIPFVPIVLQPTTCPWKNALLHRSLVISILSKRCGSVPVKLDQISKMRKRIE
jgi:hypothetical protein